MVYGVPVCYFCILAIGQTLADIAEQVSDFNAHEFGRKGGQGILGVTELSCPSMAVVSLQVQEANRRLDQSMVKQAQGILSRAAAKHTTVAPLTHNLLKRGNRPESGHPGPTTASRLARRLPAKGPPRLGSSCPGPGKSAKDIGQFGYLQLPIPEFIPAQPQPPPGGLFSGAWSVFLDLSQSGPQPGPVDAKGRRVARPAAAARIRNSVPLRR